MPAGCVGQPLDHLLEDAIALAQLFDPHQEAVVHVADRADRDVEVELVVDAVGLGSPYVVGDPRGAQRFV